MTRPDSPRPEPVAWQIIRSEHDRTKDFVTDDLNAVFAAKHRGEKLIPLYPHPSAAAGAGQPSGDSGTLAHEPVSNAYTLPSAPEVPVVTEADALVALLREAACDIEAAVHAEYGYPDVHPAMQRKYQRDIAIVSQLRTAAETITAAREVRG
jgi:hypothetical protein